MMSAGSVSTASEQSRLAIDEGTGHRGILKKEALNAAIFSRGGRDCGDSRLDVVSTPVPLAILGAENPASHWGCMASTATCNNPSALLSSSCWSGISQMINTSRRMCS